MRRVRIRARMSFLYNPWRTSSKPFPVKKLLMRSWENMSAMSSWIWLGLIVIPNTLIPHATSYVVFDTTRDELHRIWHHILRSTSCLIPHATNYVIFGFVRLFVARLLLAVCAKIVIGNSWNDCYCLFVARLFLLLAIRGTIVDGNLWHDCAWLFVAIHDKGFSWYATCVRLWIAGGSLPLKGL